MNDVYTQNAVDKLYSHFMEQNPDADKGKYLCAKTNRLLAFEDYINQLWDIQIQLIVQRPLGSKDIRQLRQNISHSIEKYLIDNLKTLAIY